MFVYSVKSSRLKLAVLVLIVLISVIALIFVTRDAQEANSQSAVTLKASNSGERVAFLSQFGWEISEDPIEVAEVIIPAEFDDVYENYNEIQKTQDFDLSKYHGQRVKRWTYEIKNYDGYGADSGCIRANILVYNGLVIGGDVCSIELNGFMHGFERPAPVQQSTAEQTEVQATTASPAQTEVQATTASPAQAEAQTTTLPAAA